MTAELFAEPIGLSRDPHKEDRWVKRNRYKLPHPEKPGEILDAGRASELGKTVSNTFTLNQWHVDQTVKGMAMRPSLGMDVFIAMNDGLTLAQLRDRVREAGREAQGLAGSKEPASRGIGYHRLTELVDAGKIDQIPDPWGRDIAAYSAILRKTGIQCVPEYTEKIIWNKSLNHCGKFDRLVRYLRHCDKWHAEDLKTGRTLDYGLAEIPVQLDVYAGADWLFDMDTERWERAPEICREIGLVTHIPLESATATLYEVELGTVIPMPYAMNATPADLCIAAQQWIKAAKKAWRAVARIEITEDGEVVDAELTWAEQMRLATTDAEMEAIRNRGKAAGTWTGWDTRRFNELTETLMA